MLALCRNLIIIAFALASLASRAADEGPVIELHEQMIGPAIKTHAVQLLSNGDIVEEIWDWTVANNGQPRSVRLICTLPSSDADRVSDSAFMLSEGLPRYVDPDVPVTIDGPYKSIRVLHLGERIRSFWHDPVHPPKTDQSRQFMASWEEIHRLLSCKDRPNSSLKRTVQSLRD